MCARVCIVPGCLWCSCVVCRSGLQPLFFSFPDRHACQSTSCQLFYDHVSEPHSTGERGRGRETEGRERERERVGTEIEMRERQKDREREMREKEKARGTCRIKTASHV